MEQAAVMHTGKLALFVLGALLMSLPGFAAQLVWASLALMAGGYVVFIVATVKNGASRPGTALTLLIASNVAFWLGYGLCAIRLKFTAMFPHEGVDPFALSVALWVILFPTFVLYEVVVFFRGIAANHDRRTATIGLVACVAELLLTLRTAYGLLQGV
jgi:hypothetical protein